MNAVASFPALGTTAVVVTRDPAGLAAACAAVRCELAAVDAACSRFREDSELARVNAADGRAVRVGPRLREAVRTALHAAERTGGLVDPTVGASLRGLGYDRTFSLVRAREGASCTVRVVAAAGWRCVELDDDAGTLRLPRGAELDLGATAKALAADSSAREAAAAAGCGVLVALGGDVAAAGAAPPDGWPVRIAEDHAAPLDAAGPVVCIDSGGLATSSTTVRSWRAGTSVVHHIVDPRTGEAARSCWRTVTVAATSCVDANVASTASIVLARDAPAWLTARGLPARLVGQFGDLELVAGWPADGKAA